MGNPYFRFGLLSLIGIAMLMLGALAVFSNLLLAWLLAVNVVAVAMYRYDKAIAGSTRTRVPELILHALTALGGTPGSAFAMWVMRPRHKTQSPNFRLRFLLILTLQIAALGILGCWNYFR